MTYFFEDKVLIGGINRLASVRILESRQNIILVFVTSSMETLDQGMVSKLLLAKMFSKFDFSGHHKANRH